MKLDVLQRMSRASSVALPVRLLDGKLGTLVVPPTSDAYCFIALDGEPERVYIHCDALHLNSSGVLEEHAQTTFVTVPLFDARLGRISDGGYLPPQGIVVRFKLLTGETVVGLTGRLTMPLLNEPGMNSSSTVFIELDADLAAKRVFHSPEVASWENHTDCIGQWATGAAVMALKSELSLQNQFGDQQ